MYDEPDCAEILSEVIHEASAARVVPEGPPHRMHHQARAVLSRREFPKFLQSDAEFLWLTSGAKIILCEQALAQRAARPFGEQRVFAEQRDAGRVRILVMAVAGHTQVAGHDALYLARFTEDEVDRGKTRIDFNTQPFCFPRQPTAEIAEAGDVHTMIAHQRGHDEIGNAQTSSCAEIVKTILPDRGLEGRPFKPPIGNKFVERHGIDHRTRKNVGADLRPLLEDAYTQLAIRCGRELLQPYCRRQPRGAAAYDYDIVLHAFALRMAHAFFREWRNRRQSPIISP